MNTILLQKILDLLKDNLTGAGAFIKSIFVHDPQDNQILSYDAEIGKWVNKDATEVELDLINTVGPNTIITFSDASSMPLKSLVANINVAGGTDNVIITHTGKNLLSKPFIYNDNDALDSLSECFFIKAGSYIASFDTMTNADNWRFIIRLKDANGNNLSSSEYITFNTGFQWSATRKAWINNSNTTSHICLFTLNQDCYIRILFGVGNASASSVASNAQLEIGSYATAYEPYDGTIETVTLPSSVANGYVDVISGKGMNIDTSTAFTVTPVHISTYTRVNNIYADTGDVSAEYYTKTAGVINDIVCITEDITSEVTKNTTDFSDILLKISQNNKVVSIEIYSASTSSALIGTFLSNLPKPAMNSKVLLANTTLGEDGIILGTLKTSGELEITTTGAKSFSGLITYVAK